jgi:hypothetical protein
MSRLAVITYLDGRGDTVDPGYGVPSVPSYGGGHPGNALPPPGSIATLPVFPFDPTIDNTLPGSGGNIDNTLPTPPAMKPIVPGAKYVVKWLACHGLILVPDNSLPETAQPK